MFEKLVNSSKQSIEFKLNELQTMFDQEVAKLDKYCGKIKGSVDTLVVGIRTMIEDVQAFNKEYDKG